MGDKDLLDLYRCYLYVYMKILPWVSSHERKMHTSFMLCMHLAFVNVLGEGCLIFIKITDHRDL